MVVETFLRQAAYSPPMASRSDAELHGPMLDMAAASCLLLRSDKRTWLLPRVHSFCVKANIDMMSWTSSLTLASEEEEDSGEREPQMRPNIRIPDLRT